MPTNIAIMFTLLGCFSMAISFKRLLEADEAVRRGSSDYRVHRNNIFIRNQRGIVFVAITLLVLWFGVVAY